MTFQRIFSKSRNRFLLYARAGRMYLENKKEDTKPGAFFRLQLEQIRTSVTDAPTGDAIGRVTSQHLRQGAFAAAITTHHRMDLASTDLQIHTVEDGLSLNGSMQIVDIEQQLGVRTDHG